MNSMRGSDDQQLDALFRAYHAACAAPEASANFMPDLWARIESRQRFTFSFGRMASALATAAVALSIMLGVYMSIPQSNAAYYNETYVEALAASNSVDAPDIVGPVVIDLSERHVR
jgi:hypothetical protein